MIRRQLARRRLEGHVGRRRPRRSADREHRPPALPDLRYGTWSSQQQQQQQQVRSRA